MPTERSTYIGKVARETGLSVDAIRLYEREGLLRKPLRSQGGYRLFDENDVADLKFVRRAQGLGFSLQEIRELLILGRSNTQRCSHTRDLIREKLTLVEAKIEELTRLRDELKKDLRKCDRELKGKQGRAEEFCPVLEEFGRGEERREVKT
jgi:DNA-binding transcriptional MerR regulator